MNCRTCGETIDFVLVPDSGAARRMRRAIAADSARLGVLVGTWPELLQQAVHAWQIVPPADSWRELLAQTAESMPAAFWRKSLEVAPEDVLDCLDAQLTQLLHATPPGSFLTCGPEAAALSQRGGRHLTELAALHSAMDGALPAELQTIDALLAADAGAAGFAVRLYRLDHLPHLSVRQAALAEKLLRDFGPGDDPELHRLLTGLLAAEQAGRGALGLLQTALYRGHDRVVDVDGSLQWVAVRDPLEEVEILAGMLQKGMAADPGCAWSDLGILLPDDAGYVAAIAGLFPQAGIPLSGLPVSRPVRDIGAELVHAFLQVQQPPSPGMAVAALASSPLMPWSKGHGQRLAWSYLEGNGLPEDNPLQALIAKAPDSAADLCGRLEKLRGMLTAGEGWQRHLERARGLIQLLLDRLDEAGEADWPALMRLTEPQRLSGDDPTEYFREGVAVFLEGHEPWRTCRKLFVLGFSSGRYPRAASVSPVFSADDLQALKSRCGFVLELPEELQRRRRELFRRQLAAASDEAVFFVPRRSGDGEELHPSETLTFMAGLCRGVGSPEELLLDIDSPEERSRIRYLALAGPGEPEPARALRAEDLRLGCDLLARRTDREGKQKPESPSGLETLMVSPLAWLLRRYDLEPRDWAPDTLDVMLKGSLAHGVFEHLFAPGRPVPAAAEIRRQVPALLRQAVGGLAPMLESAEWRVERQHLEQEITTAALRWGEILAELKAAVLGAESTLAGRLDALPLSGKADLLLGLPGNRLLVVDYKKSGSSSRRERMEKGFDCQAHLYRLMLENGGVVDGDERLAQVIRSAGEIAVMYYLMNDQTALSDSTGWSGGTVAGLKELGGGISDRAMKLIRERIGQLEQGLVAMNAADDEAWFNSEAGIKPYALENSPLIRLFMKRSGPVASEREEMIS